MSTVDRTSAVVRGLVKAVFVLCYAAFMWASIHHLAAFFNDFEAGNGNTLGSYALAAAFDVTALVTTIGVMFFRKSMPRPVQWIVWGFILAIAIYSFFMNWEYASHYQSTSLILQPTGETMPVYDSQGGLHYVPVMRANTLLLYINPALASGFTLFALIYSVIAEFFGTKLPTIDELQARKQYLEETGSVLESIRQLEGKQKGKGLIERGKEKAIESVTALNEVRKAFSSEQETEQKTERNTDELKVLTSEESTQETSKQIADTREESITVHDKKVEGNQEENVYAFTEENIPSWLSASGSTIPLQTVVQHTKLNIRMLRNRVESKQIRATKNKDIVYKDSLIQWMKEQGILQETATQSQRNAIESEPIENGLIPLNVVATSEEPVQQNGHTHVIV